MKILNEKHVVKVQKKKKKIWKIMEQASRRGSKWALIFQTHWERAEAERRYPSERDTRIPI